MPINTNPTIGSTTLPTTPEATSGLALHYAQMYIDGAAATRHYSDFDKSESEFGAIIETLRVPASTSSAVNRDSTSLPAPAYKTPVVRYFSDWAEKQYVATVPDSQLEKAVGNAEEFARLTATIINSNAEGEAMDSDDNYRALFYQDSAEYTARGNKPGLLARNSSGALVGFLKDNNQYEQLEGLTGSNVFETVYSELAKISKSMTYNNSEYSGGFRCGSYLDDLRIILPTAFTAAAGVQFMTRLYNLAEVGKLPKIIECDGMTDTVNGNNMAVAYILDIRAIGRAVRGRRSEAIRPPLRWRTDYASKLEDMFYYAPMYKAYGIVFNLPASGQVAIGTAAAYGEGIIISNFNAKVNGASVTPTTISNTSTFPVNEGDTVTVHAESDSLISTLKIVANGTTTPIALADGSTSIDATFTAPAPFFNIIVS